MGNENMRPVSRKMMFGIMGVLGLLLVGGVLISALKLFKPNEPEQQGDTSAQPSGIPAGITVEAQDVSRWVVSTTLIPPLDYHERQLRYLAVNRTVFLWVQFRVTETKLPREIDVMKIRAVPSGGAAVPVAGFGTPRFNKPYLREPMPCIDAILSAEPIPQSVDPYSNIPDFGFQPGPFSGNMDSEAISYSYNTRGEKTATITIKKTPVSFSLVFVVSVGTKEITINDLWDEPITVSVDSDGPQAAPEAAPENPPDNPAPEEDNAAQADGPRTSDEMRELMDSLGFHSILDDPSKIYDPNGILCWYVWICSDEKSGEVISLLQRPSSVREFEVRAYEAKDYPGILRVAEKISKELHDACVECMDTYKSTQEECSKDVGHYRVTVSKESAISIKTIPPQE